MARKWATEEVESELKTFMIPLANPDDTVGAASAINQLSMALTPRKVNPNNGMQAQITQQLQSAAPAGSQTPIAVTTAEAERELAADPELDDDEKGRTVSNLSKRQQVEKTKGQIMSHMLKILEAQTPDFKAASRAFGKSTSMLQPSIDAVDLGEFRKEMLRIFNLTYDPADRAEQLRVRITDVEYKNGTELSVFVNDLDELIMDIVSIPEQKHELFRVLNRNIWISMNKCHVEKFKAIAANVDVSNMTLEQTRNKLLGMHRDIGEGGYKSIRVHKATIAQSPSTTEDCPACAHNFGESYKHTLQKCRANPRLEDERNRSWFQHMWSTRNPSDTAKKPYAFEAAPRQQTDTQTGPALKKSRSY